MHLDIELKLVGHGEVECSLNVLDDEAEALDDEVALNCKRIEGSLENATKEELIARLQCVQNGYSSTRRELRKATARRECH